MKITMYGTEICGDCVRAKELLSHYEDIELDYRNITDNTAILKEFLSYRDHEKMFAPVIDSGKIGIPFFILDDGTKTFEVTDFIEGDINPPEQTVNACSIDGRGIC